MPHAGPDSHITYRPLHNYKYQLVDDYSYPTGITLNTSVSLDDDWVRLDVDGTLTLKNRYAWDGATKAPDTKEIMRGSLIHDALYQLISAGRLEGSDKETADRVLQSICIEDGMNRWRARVVYEAVKRFGQAAPRTTPDPKTAP